MCMVLNLNILYYELNADSQLFVGDPLRADKLCSLLSHLLHCLHKCFLHCQTAPTSSSSSFLTRERFDTLMPPLVNQVCVCVCVCACVRACVCAGLYIEGQSKPSLFLFSPSLPSLSRSAMWLEEKRRSRIAWRSVSVRVWLSWLWQPAERNCGNHSTIRFFSKPDTSRLR